MSKTEHATACKTAKGRERCAAAVEDLAKRMGATGSRSPHYEHAPRRIQLELAFGPYRCSMSFDGDSNVGAFLGHWFVSIDSNARYPKAFGVAINGTVNTYHYSKATTCEGAFWTFLYSLEKGLATLANENPELIKVAA